MAKGHEFMYDIYIDISCNSLLYGSPFPPLKKKGFMKS